MKIVTTTAFLAFVATATAFSPASVARPSSHLQSAVAEETATEKPKPGPTRFDRLKQLYKGPTLDEPDEPLGFSYDDFAAAVAETEYLFERNSVVQGTIVEHAGSGSLVDIGAKASAFLPNQEASLDPDIPVEEAVPVNTSMEFQIISEEDENGQLMVSVKRIQYQKAWESVIAISEQDEVIEAKVVAVNRGGAICMVEGLRAFLPGSHLAGRLPDEDMVGTSLPLKFLEVNRENNKLVVSNRKAVVEQQMSELSRGDVVSGVVKALKPYGAFVEVNGMSGLLHISQISYDRIDDLEKVVQPGMQVKCMIIDHDKVNGRIALSTKTLEAEAGAMLKDPEMVFEKAEETAVAYHARMEEQQQAREAAARDIVLGLSDSLDGLDGSDGASSSEDPLQNVSDSLDSLLS